jgi:hypothetical protein
MKMIESINENDGGSDGVTTTDDQSSFIDISGISSDFSGEYQS